MSRADRWSNADLDDFVPDEEPDDEPEPEADTRPAWEPQQEDDPDTGARVRCPCGNTPSQRFARVFGDNDDEIDFCPDCGTYREMKDGAILRDGDSK